MFQAADADSWLNTLNGGLAQILQAGVDRTVSEINPHLTPKQPEVTQSLSDQQDKAPTQPVQVGATPTAGTAVAATPPPGLPPWVVPAGIAGAVVIVVLLATR